MSTPPAPSVVESKTVPPSVSTLSLTESPSDDGDSSTDAESEDCDSSADPESEKLPLPAVPTQLNSRAEQLAVTPSAMTGSLSRQRYECFWERPVLHGRVLEPHRPSLQTCKDCDHDYCTTCCRLYCPCIWHGSVYAASRWLTDIPANCC